MNFLVLWEHMMSDTADQWSHPTEEAEAEESDGSTMDCWECGCVHAPVRSTNVELPVRAPLYGEDANEAKKKKKE